MTCYKEATKRLNEQFLSAIVYHYENVHISGSMAHLMQQYETLMQRFENDDESILDDPFTFTHELNLNRVPRELADDVGESLTK